MMKPEKMYVGVIEVPDLRYCTGYNMDKFTNIRRDEILLTRRYVIVIIRAFLVFSFLVFSFLFMLLLFF